MVAYFQTPLKKDGFIPIKRGPYLTGIFHMTYARDWRGVLGFICHHFILTN